MFGTIGWMYQCYYDYLSLRYDDGTTLWDARVQQGPAQSRTTCSTTPSGRPSDARIPLGFKTTIALDLSARSPRSRCCRLMDAITDQGEGSDPALKRGTCRRRSRAVRAALPSPITDALASDYPSYDDNGKLAPSADADARGGNDHDDHYERFLEVQTLICDRDVTTWAAVAEAHGALDGGRPQDSRTRPDASPMTSCPTADDIAGGHERLAKEPERSHTLLSQAAIGAIAGVTTVLNNYWSAGGRTPVPSPIPSMAGSGDRMAIAWAVTGQTPDLSRRHRSADADGLYHACQGLDLDGDTAINDCAAGLDLPHLQGIERLPRPGRLRLRRRLTTGGGNCGSSSRRLPRSRAGGGCAHGDPQIRQACAAGRRRGRATYSAPSDNKCGAFGGCAVPISASQLYPTSGVMQTFDFEPDPTTKADHLRADLPDAPSRSAIRSTTSPTRRIAEVMSRPA